MERPLFLLSIVSLGLGGLLAFLVALARTPILYKLFPPGYFYHALVGHVDLAIVVFLLTFTMLLWNRFMPKRDPISFYLVLLGFLGIAFISFSGNGTAVPNNYLPTIDHPLFFAGAILFFSGFWLAGLETGSSKITGTSTKSPEKKRKERFAYLKSFNPCSTPKSLAKKYHENSKTAPFRN